MSKNDIILFQHGSKGMRHSVVPRIISDPSRIFAEILKEEEDARIHILGKKFLLSNFLFYTIKHWRDDYYYFRIGCLKNQYHRTISSGNMHKGAAVDMLKLLHYAGEYFRRYFFLNKLGLIRVPGCSVEGLVSDITHYQVCLINLNRYSDTVIRNYFCSLGVQQECIRVRFKGVERSGPMLILHDRRTKTEGVSKMVDFWKGEIEKLIKPSLKAKEKESAPVKQVEKGPPLVEV